MAYGVTATALLRFLLMSGSGLGSVRIMMAVQKGFSFVSGTAHGVPALVGFYMFNSGESCYDRMIGAVYEY